MRVAVIGSRKLKIEHLERYLPKETTEIVSGGAIGTSKNVQLELILMHGNMRIPIPAS